MKKEIPKKSGRTKVKKESKPKYECVHSRANGVQAVRLVFFSVDIGQTKKKPKKC